MTTEKFFISGAKQPPEIHELEVKPITLIVKDGDMNGEVEPVSDRIVITADMTVHHAQLCKQWHTDTQAWVNYLKPEASVATDTAARHLQGLVDLSLKFRDMGKQFMWRYPETYLHPKVQCQLADFMIFLALGKDVRK